MVDFNSLTAKYIKENSNVSFSDVEESMNNVTKNMDYDSDSVFETAKDSSQEEFVEFMKQSTGVTDDAFIEDANMLFEILDADNDGVLSSEELKVITQRSKGTVTEFAIKDEIKKLDKDEVNEDLAAIDSSDDDTNPTTGNEDDDINPTTGNEDDDINPTTGNEDDGTNPTTGNTDKDKTPPEAEPVSENPDVNKLRQKIYDIVMESDSDNYKTPEDVISELEASGEYSEEVIRELRSSYITYSQEDESKIDAKLEALKLTNPDATRQDAIDALQGQIGAPIKDSNSEIEVAPTVIDNTAAKNNAEKLKDAMHRVGTDDSDVKEVFEDSSLSSADWVQIIKEYGDDPCLVSDLDGDFIDANEEKYLNKIVDSLLEESMKGNEDALMVLCKQIHGATAGQSGTADKFIEILFSKIDDETLYYLNDAYNTLYEDEDSSLRKDIKNDYKAGGFLWWTNGTGDDYLEKLDKAINKYGRQ